MAHGQVTAVVAAAVLLDRLKKGLVRLVRRDLSEVRDRREAPTSRSRLVLLNSHLNSSRPIANRRMGVRLSLRL